LTPDYFPNVEPRSALGFHIHGVTYGVLHKARAVFFGINFPDFLHAQTKSLWINAGAQFKTLE